MFMPRMRFLGVLAIGCIAATLQAASPQQPSRGITADGRVVTSPSGVAPPWGADITRLVNPNYPESLRAQHPSVTGFYRLILDLKTGRVRRVMVEQSSGYPAIDSSIVAALRQWQLKPNRWREFEVHVGLSYSKKR
jgi:TonB family protein